MKELKRACTAVALRGAAAAAVVRAAAAAVVVMALCASSAQADLASGFAAAAEQQAASAGASAEKRGFSLGAGAVSGADAAGENFTDDLEISSNGASLEEKILKILQSDWPNVLVTSLQLSEEMPANCELEGSFRPLPSVVLRLNCGQKIKFVRAKIEAKIRAFRLVKDLEKGENLAAASREVLLPLNAANLGAVGVLEATDSARSRLKKGQILRAANIAAELVIKKGDAVNLAVLDGALAASTQGFALNDAAAGERVRIRLENGKTLGAIAIARALARLP